MATSPLLSEEELSLIVRYSIEDEETIIEAVVNAFLAAGLNPFERSTQLVDYLNPDVFENDAWSADRPFYFCTRIWDHQVMMTPEEVRIYRRSTPSASGPDPEGEGRKLG